MTAYELLDLRREYVADVTNYYKFWISMTFAVIVAAHVAGPEMGAAGAAMAIILYAAFSVTIILGMMRVFAVINSLNQDIKNFTEETPGAPSVLSSVSSIIDMQKSVVGIQSIGLVAATVYVLYRAGFIG